MPPPITPVSTHLGILQTLHEALTLQNRRYQSELQALNHHVNVTTRTDLDASRTATVWVWDAPEQGWWMPRLGPKKSALDDQAKAARATATEIVDEVEQHCWFGPSAVECKRVAAELKKLAKDILG